MRWECGELYGCGREFGSLEAPGDGRRLRVVRNVLEGPDLWDSGADGVGLGQGGVLSGMCGPEDCGVGEGKGEDVGRFGYVVGVG